MFKKYLSYLKKNLSSSKFWHRWLIRFLIFFISFYGILKIDNSAVRYCLIIVSPFIIGALACGWWCPAGLLQEIVFIKKYSVNISDSIHKKARWLRFIFAVLFFTGIFSIPGFVQKNIGGFISSPLEISLSVATYLAIFSIFISVFIQRFFCKYFCPFGAMSGLRSLLRPVTINRNATACISCKMCDKVCCMKIKMSNCVSSLSPNCVQCFRCIEFCPKKALYIGKRSYLSDDLKNSGDNLF
ncbi:MAG: 4Fe-4S binding protein [Rickettsiales bacterium]|jgi:polyferredoxin|nr:4Fe-4S binding protein [Rickettsiales bacterium]